MFEVGWTCDKIGEERPAKKAREEEDSMKVCGRLKIQWKHSRTLKRKRQTPRSVKPCHGWKGVAKNRAPLTLCKREKELRS